jgi:hypothetical protein
LKSALHESCRKLNFKQLLFWGKFVKTSFSSSNLKLNQIGKSGKCIYKKKNLFPAIPGLAPFSAQLGKPARPAPTSASSRLRMPRGRTSPAPAYSLRVLARLGCSPHSPPRSPAAAATPWRTLAPPLAIVAPPPPHAPADASPANSSRPQPRLVSLHLVLAPVPPLELR